MSHSDKKSSGMSRAAQNKRKKLNKVQNLILAPSLNNQQSEEDDSDREISKPVKKAKKSHKEKPTHAPVSDILTKFDGLNEDIDLTGITLSSILGMKEIEEIKSKERASLLLSKIIFPTTLPEFYDSIWEKRPLFNEHNDKKYFKDIVNFEDTSSMSNIDKIFKEQLFYEGDDMTFTNGEGTLDVSGKLVDPEEVVEDKEPVQINYKQIQKRLTASNTVNFLTPQKNHDSIWKLLSALEHEFDATVGANVIISPPNSTSNERQYDNRCSFILQLKGSSDWSVWAPFKGKELSRTSGTAASNDITISDDTTPIDREERKNDPPTHKYTLKTGDSLYMPKGWMYQQVNNKDTQSYVLKIVTNQSHSYADLMDLLLPQAMFEAAQSSLSFRKCLPRQLSSFQGVLVQEDESIDIQNKRTALQNHMKSLLDKMVEVALDVLDPATDQMTKKFLGERLPVPLTEEEEKYTKSDCTIYPYTKLRMIRPGVASVFVEDGQCVVYHCMANSREKFGVELQPIEFELDDGPTIEQLLRAYPEGVTVSELYHPDEQLEDKIGVAQALFKEGFLMIVDEASKPAEEGNDDDGYNSDDPF